MATPITNFGLVTVSGTYNASATTITLTTGHGSKLPATTGGFRYELTWWNATDYAHPADDPNVEIVIVTDLSGDTATVLRGQSGTSASTKDTAAKTYRMSLGITKSMWEGTAKPKELHLGLQLQTHRDSDKAAYQVELVGVDSIIMNDGTELRNDNGEWTGKVADITLSGVAGGLDTGTETVSWWYEIFAIAKEDETRNLLLHKSKLWSIDTGSVVGEDATQGIRSNIDNSTVKVAQGFKGNGGFVKFIHAKLIKVGSPTGSIWFTIETDNAGKPSGTAVATSHLYDVARLSTTAMTVRFPMKTSANLSASPVQYHLVAQGTWAVSATNYVGWRMDGSAGGFGTGSKALYDSDTATWTTDTDDDMIFAVGMETDNTSLVLPSGYTKQCFLGWVFNNGSSDFLPFVQVDRSRRSSAITTDNRNISFSGNPELVELIGLPPRPLITALLGIDGTGTGGGVVAIGNLNATDISYLGDTVGAQILLYSAITAPIPSTFGEVVVQYGAVMVHGTSGANLWTVGFSW